MRALVTGAAGFIGGHLCRSLIDDGQEVVGLDSFTDFYDPASKRTIAAALAGERFTLAEADLNLVDLEALLDGVDTVFHLAGQPGVRGSWGSSFAQYTLANIDATQRLLEAVRDHPSVRRLVYASSSSIYGNAETFPTLESTTPAPISPYGVTKLAGEQLCVLFASEFGVPTVALRYFTVYGPRQRPDMAFTRFIRAGLTGQTISVFGDGAQRREFTYVDDVVAATRLAGSSEIAVGSVFNVSGGSQASVAQTLELIASAVGRSLQIEHIDRAAGDARETGGSTEAIRAALGWTPTVSLETGIGRQVEWGREVFG